MGIHYYKEDGISTFNWSSSGDNRVDVTRSFDFGIAKNFADKIVIVHRCENMQGDASYNPMWIGKRINGVGVGSDGGYQDYDHHEKPSGYEENWSLTTPREKVANYLCSHPEFRVGMNTLWYTAQNEAKDRMFLGFVFQVALHMSDSKEPIPTIGTLSASSDGNLIDNPLNISWSGNNQGVVKIYVNDSLKATITDGTKSKQLPAFTCKEGENKIKLVIENYPVPNFPTLGGKVEKEITITQSRIKPNISGLKFNTSSNLIDDIQNVSWSSSNQSIANIYINGTKKFSIDTAKEFNIPPGNFKVGENTLEVEVIYFSGDTTWLIAKQSIKKTFERLEPTISDLAVDQTNRDKKTILSWKSTNETDFKVYVNGSAQPNSKTIRPGVFREGKNDLKVEVWYTTSYGARLKAEQTVNVTFTQNTPSIISLEPSELNINIDLNNKVTFATNDFCDRWELLLNDSLTYKGTNERELTIAARTFKKQTNKIQLTIYYTPEWSTSEIRSAQKTVMFFGYGKPLPPAQDQTTEYETSKPKLTWEIEEFETQKEVLLRVLKDSVEIVSVSLFDEKQRSYTLTVDLENKTEYTCEISYMNAYSIWSSVSKKSFVTEFSSLPKPVIECHSMNETVSITISGFQVENFKENVIFRKTDREDWIIIADNLNTVDSIVDGLAPSDTTLYYKVRSYNNDGGYIESDIVKTYLNIRSMSILDLNRNSGVANIEFTETDITHNSYKVKKIFAGATKPKMFYSPVHYDTMNIKIMIFNPQNTYILRDYFESGDTFCYRDWRGKKMFCDITINKIDRIKTYEVMNITLTEIYFNETKFYHGSGYRKILYLDGSVKLDGSQLLDGWGR